MRIHPGFMVAIHAEKNFSGACQYFHSSEFDILYRRMQSSRQSSEIFQFYKRYTIMNPTHWMNFFKPVFLIIALTLFAACGVSLVVPSQADVDRVAGKYPDYSLTELREGKKIYEQHCSDCHRLQEPASKSAAKWGRIVPEMSTKVNRKAGKEVINASQQDLLLRYLITMGPEQRGK